MDNKKIKESVSKVQEIQQPEKINSKRAIQPTEQHKRHRKNRPNKNVRKLQKMLQTKKLRRLRITRIMFVLFVTFTVLYVIGLHSDYLIVKPIPYILLGLMIITAIGFIIALVKYFTKEKNYTLPVKRWWLNIICIVYAVSCTAFLCLLYGPNDAFKDWLVTTAMATMNHQYICKIFYSTEEIQKVLDNNYIVEPEGNTDTSLVEVQDDNGTFKYDKDNKYEVQMFKNHTKDEIYRLIKFKVNDQQAYLAVVYNPANVSVVVSKYALNAGEYVVDMAKRTNALIAINGGRFIDPNWSSAGGNPDGVTIVNSKIITNHDYGGELGVIGFNKDDVLVLYKGKNAQELIDLKVRDCVTSQPFLIVNGESAITKGNGGYGYAARTAIGQRADGVTLLLVVDSNQTRTNGATMKDLTEIFQNYGAVNAAALDGGTSSSMVENGKMISVPINASFKVATRPVATGIIVTDSTNNAELKSTKKSK